MKKSSFKNKVISIFIAVIMLIGVMPVMAGNAQSISITANGTNWDEGYNFTPSGSDKLTMQMFTDAFERETKPWVSYSIYVEEPGPYTIEFKTSPLADGKYTSPATFSINGVAITPDLKQSVDVNTKVYSTYANLNAGKNIIRFDITGKKPNAGATGEQGLFWVFYFNATPYVSKTIVDGNTLVVEAENYDATTHSLVERTDNATSCYGNDYYHTNVQSTAVTLTYSVLASDEGSYDMTLYASSKENYLGRYEVLINGTLVGDMRDNGVFTSHKKTVCGNATWMIREFYPVEATLKKGVNTLIIRSYDKGTNGNYGFALDCFKFAPKSVKYYGELKFEGEDATGSKELISNQDGYSGNAWNRVRGTATTTFTSPAEEYDLYITVGADVDATQHTNGKYLGKAAISIDGGDFIALDGTNTTKVAGLTGTGASITNAAKWKYNPGLTLGAGEHTFAIKYDGVGSNGNAGNAFIHYDCFELVPKNGVIGDATLEVPQYLMACGTQMQADSKLYYTNGILVGPEQNPGAKFTSSNHSVATVNANGVITAVSPGMATISAEYTANASASVKVTVYDESGIVPVSISYDDESGKAAVEFTKVTDNETNPTFIFASYDDGGTRLSSFDVEDAAKLERGRVTTVRKQITGDSVKVFTWESLENLVPMAPVLELKAVDNEKFKEYVDFVVDVEEGREPVILHLADTQIIDSAQKRYSGRLAADATEFWATDKMDELCFDYLREVVAETNPDLIILTGDIVYGEFDDNGSALTELVEAMESLGTPWAPIYGNHDNESKVGVNWQSGMLEAAPNCLFKQRTLTGNGNYSVGIAQGGELKRVFFMLDSNGGTNKSSQTLANGHSVTTTGFGEDQIAWYTDAANKINEAFGAMKYSLVYHIPQFIFNHGYNKYSGYEPPVDIATIQDEVENAPGTDFGYIGKKLSNGWNTDISIYRAAKAFGCDSHFVGHEHAQSTSITHDGTLLQFGQKSSAYDSLNWIDSEGNVVNGACLTDATPMVGGTVLKMNADGGFGTRYIHYCDGEITAE